MSSVRIILYNSVPENQKHVQHHKVYDILQGIYAILLALPTESAKIFVALDLNNFPCLDLKNVDGASIICHQNKCTKPCLPTN